MIVLGIDTATHVAGVALVDDERGILDERRHGGGGRGADLLVAVDAACKQAGVTPAQLGAIAVGAGPGSFTGLRIGMATAKGIAFAAARPLWSVSSLAALAHEAARGDGLVVAALDARRGEVFAGAFRGGAPVAPERAMAPADLAAWARELAAATEAITYCGDAITAYDDVLGALAVAWSPVRTPSGAAVAQLALAGPRTDILLGGAPMYIRPSEAEVMYPDGVPGALVRRPP
ncbi:MAG: tRNA (adenosine(37)-N6)-threonylcarbamoyltransferase complex dimerization subunit type 1 TsaB [Deltaproteobacteria bacterium]|nr:tRNA (adenosine(37)-N6)-threonylcarbamoyltransferase complex dimerization subunit type 1 TsaB [Deltaproteobacteria bacterium]